MVAVCGGCVWLSVVAVWSLCVDVCVCVWLCVEAVCGCVWLSVCLDVCGGCVWWLCVDECG